MSKKSITKKVSYRFPVKVVSALARRAADTRRAQTTVVLMALEKELSLP